MLVLPIPCIMIIISLPFVHFIFIFKGTRAVGDAHRESNSRHGKCKEVLWGLW